MSGYGAINTNEPTDLESSFEEYNTVFIKDRELTKQERVNKCLTAGVPIVIGLILMLGFGVWASNALAPHHNPKDYAAIPFQPTPFQPAPPAPTPTYSSKAMEAPLSSPISTSSTTNKSSAASTTSSHSDSSTSNSDSGKSCSANPSCTELGLTGNCCPTNKGVSLECCS